MEYYLALKREGTLFYIIFENSFIWVHQILVAETLVADILES